MENVIKGRELMVFVSGTTGLHTIALATNHTLTINADSIDASNKDAGAWNKQNTSKLSWEMSTENLFSYNSGATQITYDKLFQSMVACEELTLVFALASGNTGATEAGGLVSGDWGNQAPKYSGKAVITSLELNAADGDMASFSATFTGSGPLAKITT